ncbi:hypothetical protein PV761_03315 [Arthrobacter sp. CC3]|uniref:hypothetical protein n=1 Tax=Arthrobacter sp. CC3 TaxID=3029185 RepID=UPI0032634A8E
MSIRIQTNIPAGDMEVTIPTHLTISESGTRQLRDALIEGSNRILRAYGQEELHLMDPAQVAEPHGG